MDKAWDVVLHYYYRSCRAFCIQQAENQSDDCAHKRCARVLVVGDVHVNDAKSLLKADGIHEPILVSTECDPYLLGARDRKSLTTRQLTYRKNTLSQLSNQKGKGVGYDVLIFSPNVATKSGVYVSNFKTRLLRAVTYLSELLTKDGVAIIVVPPTATEAFFEIVNQGCKTLALQQQRGDGVLIITCR
jgi:hypothetical protein